MIPKYINWVFNLPGGLTLLVCLGWLYAVSVSLLLVGPLSITAIRHLPAIITLMLRKASMRPAPPDPAFLELRFPSVTAKSAYATEQLHIILRGLSSRKRWLEKISGRKACYSLEVAATEADGIRFIMCVPAGDVRTVSDSLLSFLPGLKIRLVTDYLKPFDGVPAEITEVVLSRDFALPLKAQKAVLEHDTVAYLTGQMTKLEDRELIAIQTVVTPVSRSTHFRVPRRVAAIESTIARGERIAPELNRRVPRSVSLCLMLPIHIAVFALKCVLAALSAFVNHHDSSGFFDYGNSNKRHPHDPYEQELANLIKAKLGQDLFELSIRILVVSASGKTRTNRSGAVASAYRMYASPYQSLVRRSRWPLWQQKQQEWLRNRFRRRLTTPHLWSYGTIVYGSELADLYHFPNTDLTRTEGLANSRSPELAAPLSVKQHRANLDVVVGRNTYDRRDTPIGLTLGQRRKHVYLIGKTGTGKTTLLTSAIYQDMLNGRGLAMLDPHGDMFQELLELVPEHRRQDVVVFDPADREYPVGLNILAPGIHFANDEDGRSWIASTVLSVFAKLTDKQFWGPRMEHILRNATLSALQLPDPNLYSLQRLLTDKKYQRDVAARLQDPVLKQFWYKEMLPLGTMVLANTVAPLTHRLGHFITDPMSRHILLQADSTLRLSDIMDEGKILLVNLSKGDIGEDQSFFFGTILTSLIWMAAYQRTKMPENKRRDFFVYIDEFQNFAAPRFSEIASEGRKFRVSLTVSHQNVAQIDDVNALKIMAGNAHSIICLKASPEDEAFILPYMEPAVKKGDIVNLTPYHFFMKTTAAESEDAFSGVTVPLEITGSTRTKDIVVSGSRKQYALAKKNVERHLSGLFAHAEPDGKRTAKAGKDRHKPVKRGL